MLQPDAKELARQISGVIAHRLYDEVLKPRAARSPADGIYLKGRHDATSDICKQLGELVKPFFPRPPHLRLVTKPRK